MTQETAPTPILGNASPAVTVVVVTYRGEHLLPACLDSLAEQTEPHRVLVIDNASSDGSARVLSQRTEAISVLRLEQNRGFSGGVAAALPLVRTPFVALLNDDATAAPDWLARLLERARRDGGTAAWTSLLVRADQPDTVSNAGVRLLPTGYGADASSGVPVSEMDKNGLVFGFCGGAALLRTDAVRAAGGFPAAYFMYYEDLDTSWRLRAAGWDITLVTDAVVAHRHAATSDATSRMFHFHNERNRLWTLIRNAPTAVAVKESVKFVATTASLALRRIRHPKVTTAANFGPGLRLSVLGATLRATPSLLRERAVIRRRSPVRRAALWRDWPTPQDPLQSTR